MADRTRLDSMLLRMYEAAERYNAEEVVRLDYPLMLEFNRLAKSCRNGTMGKYEMAREAILNSIGCGKAVTLKQRDEALERAKKIVRNEIKL